MSPLLGFTKLREKLLDGTKTQTIRKPRKRPIKVGDIVYIYWKPRTVEMEKLGEAIITKIVRKKADDFTYEDAIKDGFSDSTEGSYLRLTALNNLHSALIKMHPEITGETEFDIITWEWTKRELLKEEKTI